MSTNVEAKRTKRARDGSDEISLEEHISRKRDELIRDRQEAPKLIEKAEELRRRANDMNQQWQYRLKADLIEEAEALEQESDVRMSMTREHAFEATVVTYLKCYHKRVEVRNPVHEVRKNESIKAYVRHADLTGQHKAAVLDEFLTEMNQAPCKVAMAARDVCPRCEDVKLLLSASKSIMTCMQCGYSMTYLDATSSSTTFDEMIDYSQYSYKRVNHWSGWLTLVQGKEVHRVPDDIMNTLMHDLYHVQGVRDPTAITQKRVRDTLRKLRLRKAYDHVAQVTARLSGIRPMRISAATEEQLRNMFLQMQPAFNRHAPKSRTNFLSYGYVLYRCFQILGLNHMLGGIQLLRGRDKLLANDAIFRKMCVDLGWPLFDLPPS